MTETILKLSHICKRYNKVFVLDDVSFEVKNGEFLSILGSSGSGKSTILKLIAGIDSVSSGSIIKNEKDITNVVAKKRNVGFIFQNYALFPSMSAYNNVAYALKCKHLSKNEIKSRVNEMLKVVGLEKEAHKKPFQLSGGQQQRVAIARTLVLEPDIILLDEPLSALDTNLKASLRKFIKAMQVKYHITMIYVTHDVEEAFAMSDRILLLDDAKLVQIDTPINLYKHPANNFAKDFIRHSLQSKLKSIKECCNEK